MKKNIKLKIIIFFERGRERIQLKASGVNGISKHYLQRRETSSQGEIKANVRERESLIALTATKQIYNHHT
jgi:hypothetical protein